MEIRVFCVYKFSQISFLIDDRSKNNKIILKKEIAEMDKVRIELSFYANGSIKTSWYKVPGAVRYHAYMTQSGKSGYLYNNQNLTINCFVSPDRLPTNKDFRMYVDAYNSAGTKIAAGNSFMNITSYTYDPKKVPNNVPELKGLAAPSIKSKTATETSATITWYAQPNATGYRLNFDNRSYDLTATTKTFTGLSSNRSSYSLRWQREA